MDEARATRDATLVAIGGNIDGQGGTLGVNSMTLSSFATGFSQVVSDTDVNLGQISSNGNFYIASTNEIVDANGAAVNVSGSAATLVAGTIGSARPIDLAVERVNATSTVGIVQLSTSTNLDIALLSSAADIQLAGTGGSTITQSGDITGQGLF